MADDAVRLLLTLCDEELLAVDGAEQGVVCLPYLDRFEAPDRDVARSTAVRCLFARGLLRYDEGPHAPLVPGPGERVVALAPDLAWVLAVRREPEAVLAAQRIVAGTGTGSEGPDVLMRYVHVTSDEVVLEDVSPSGMHRFVAAPRARLAELMGQYLVVERVGPGTPAPEEAPSEGAGEAWPDDVVPARDGAGVLGGVHLVAELVVRLDDAPVTSSHTAYVSPRVAYVGTAPLDDPAAAVLTRRDPATLGEWAAGLLAAPAEGGARESGS